jgi:glycine/D-amino acid oxidase-like deaminating enzyme/nitrite reductase/ring-hydroxylating ferredoxin subunit
MNETSDHAGRLLSFWERTATSFRTAPLERTITADVVIVGAGIAGMMTAYQLSREGRKVVVLDDGAVGSGMTSRTTAHLVNALDDRYYEIETYHGAEGARLAAASHSAAIDQFETIAAEEGIDCDFERVNGYLFAPPGGSINSLDEEFAAVHRAGLTAVERVSRVPMASNFDTGPALRFPRQAQVHPLRFLTGLAASIQRRGGQIFTGTRVVHIEGGRTAKATSSDGYEVAAGAVVVATNTPINDRFVIHTKQAPYYTYVIAMAVPRGEIDPLLLWDTAQTAEEEKQQLGPVRYHYVRLARDRDNDVLIVGGEDHKTGQADDSNKRFGHLEAWARECFPVAQQITDRWSGQVMEPIDTMAFIGRNPQDEPNVFIATGDSGNGMTHGAIAGMLLPDLIAGRENPWAKLYEPSRKITHPHLLAEFAKENLNVAAQLTDYLTGGDVSSAAEIPNGGGAVLREGLKKVAAYRDEHGVLHRLSAVCPHLGCVVRWNDGERTWDCPCHGSRFNCLGDIINGPASTNLSPIEPGAQPSSEPFSPKR